MNQRCSRNGFSVIELTVAASCLAVVLAMLSPNLVTLRENARKQQCGEQLRRIAIACLNYHEVYKCFPAMRLGTTSDLGSMDPKTNSQSMSGLVSLSPFLGHTELFEQAQDNNFGPAPWESSEYWDTQLPVLLCPADASDETGRGDSNYKFVMGTTVEKTHIAQNDRSVERFNGIFGCLGTDVETQQITLGRNISMANIRDGLSNTLLLSERRIAFEKPSNDLAWVAANCETDDYEIQNLFDVVWARAFESNGSQYNEGVEVVAADPGSRWCDGRPFYAGITTIIPPNGPSCVFSNRDDREGVFTATSQHEDLVMAAMGDGSVREFVNNVDIVAWWAIGTRDGDDDIGDILD